MTGNAAASARTARDHARGVQSLLLIAAGAAGALVALKAWSLTRKVDAQRRTFSISERMLEEVFPHGKRP